MIATIAITTVLVLASTYVHYEALRWVSDSMPRMTLPLRSRLLVLIFAALIAHLVEIGLFAIGLWLMQAYWNLGALTGLVNGGAMDFFYFSASSYTTLGMGDLVPLGGMRLVAAVESLIGLVLIGWSTSFTYLAMREFWDLHPGRK